MGLLIQVLAKPACDVTGKECCLTAMKMFQNETSLYLVFASRI